VDHQDEAVLQYGLSCNISHNSGGGATDLGGGTAHTGGSGTPFLLNLTTVCWVL